MTLHIVFDVDGTLSTHHGPVTPELCFNLRARNAILWLLSEREDPTEIGLLRATFKPIGELPVYAGDNYISKKRRSLKEFILTHEKPVVYVGDRAEDFVVALLSGAIYCAPSALSEEIFDDVKAGMAFFCGGKCGKKVMFEGHLSGIL